MENIPITPTPEDQADAMTAAQVKEKAANVSQYDIMEAHLDSIASETKVLLEMADRLERNASPDKADIIRNAVYEIWDCAEGLFRNGNYDKAPGSFIKKYLKTTRTHIERSEL